MKVFMVRHISNLGEVHWGTGNNWIVPYQENGRMFNKPSPARALRTRLKKRFQNTKVEIVEFTLQETGILQ